MPAGLIRYFGMWMCSTGASGRPSPGFGVVGRLGFLVIDVSSVGGVGGTTAAGCTTAGSGAAGSGATGSGMTGSAGAAAGDAFFGCTGNREPSPWLLRVIAM